LKHFFLHGSCFAKIVPIFHFSIKNKGAHLNLALGAILHIHATAVSSALN